MNRVAFAQSVQLEMVASAMAVSCHHFGMSEAVVSRDSYLAFVGASDSVTPVAVSAGEYLLQQWWFFG